MLPHYGYPLFQPSSSLLANEEWTRMEILRCVRRHGGALETQRAIANRSAQGGIKVRATEPRRYFVRPVQRFPLFDPYSPRCFYFLSVPLSQRCISYIAGNMGMASCSYNLGGSRSRQQLSSTVEGSCSRFWDFMDYSTVRSIVWWVGSPFILIALDLLRIFFLRPRERFLIDSRIGWTAMSYKLIL